VEVQKQSRQEQIKGGGAEAEPTGEDRRWWHKSGAGGRRSKVVVRKHSQREQIDPTSLRLVGGGPWAGRRRRWIAAPCPAPWPPPARLCGG
jgi:hypothetical protein